MKINQNHPWNVSYPEARAIQQTLQKQVDLTDHIALSSIMTVAGADISWFRQTNLAFVAVLLFSYPDFSIVEEVFCTEETNFPYRSGLLSFREAPPLIKAFERLSRVPDLVIFDGQGIAHPRGLGLAAHMGILLNVPTIGCAKTKLIGEYEPVGHEKGSMSDLFYRDEIVGKVLRSKTGINPLFVSPGHQIGIENTARVVLSCCKNYRLPEPTRIAHNMVNEFRRKEL